MCGIHFILDKQRQVATEEPLRRMMQESAYRGPDASGTLCLDHPTQRAWLGSHRLQVSDPHPRADQPFMSPDGRYTLLYNGEIYNYPELRNQLLTVGVTFSTQSDTEVLLHWLILKGPTGLSLLNGMFAFVLYDRQEGVTWAARDRNGMKPLFYTENEAYLIVSSEAKGIIASGLVNWRVHEATVNPYLCFRYPPGNVTFFRHIVPLKAGHYLHRKADGNARIATYELPSAPAAHSSDEALPNTIASTLTEAVLRHWPADVPAGLFLSGGVDSTLLLALLRQEGVSVPTFSLGPAPDDARYGTRDHQFARRAAAQYEAYHEEVTVTEANLEEHFETFIQRTDQPVGDSGAFMTYLLSQTAGALVKVVLSGAGADELFGGYHRHWAYRQYLRNYSLVTRLLPLLRRVGTWLPNRGHTTGRLLGKLLRDVSLDPAETFAHFISLAPFRPLLHHLVDHDDPWLQQARHRGGSENFVEAYLQYALRHDQQHYLSSDVLAISDSMSMAHGLEMRLPYLDTELQTQVNSLSATQRLRHGRKWILRRLLEARGGKAYTQRRKEGFGLPMAQWLRRPAMPLIQQHIENSRALVYRYVDESVVIHLLRQHRQGQQDHSQALWTVLVLSAWLTHRFPEERH